MSGIPISTPVPVEQGTSPPRLSFDLDTKQSKALKDMRPGDTIRLVVTGTIKDLSFYQAESDLKKGFYGHCSLEARKMSVVGANGTYEAMMEEED